MLPDKYPNQYTQGSLLLKHAPAKQISVHTRELAHETESCNIFAPGACSLISNQFDMGEQNSGAKILLRNIFFHYKSLVQMRELFSGSMLQERAAGASSLVCTGLNKLLIKWKGPFEVSAVVGLNDYKVRVKGRERVYHANLLKMYFEREDSVPIGAVALEVNANIIL